MTNWIITNREWIFSGCGVAVISGLLVGSRFLWKRRTRRVAQVHALCGYYEVFHLSSALPGKVIRSALTITQDEWGALSLGMHSFKYRYKGTVIADLKNVTLLLDGDPHTERLIIIFSEPLTLEFDILEGVYAAPTENGVPCCGKMLARKVALPTTCDKLEPGACDAKLMRFLNSTPNPIIVPKTEPPNWEHLR